MQADAGRHRRPDDRHDPGKIGRRHARRGSAAVQFLRRVDGQRDSTAKHIGLGVVDGVECEHLAFRGPDTDWQIWIEPGAKPMPRKYVITSKTVAGAPQYTLRIRDWKTDAIADADTFVFKPPATRPRSVSIPARCRIRRTSPRHTCRSQEMITSRKTDRHSRPPLRASPAACSGTAPAACVESLVSSAEARIGRPLTPMSYAGVARRTTRRARLPSGLRASRGVGAGAYYALVLRPGRGRLRSGRDPLLTAAARTCEATGLHRNSRWNCAETRLIGRRYADEWAPLSIKAISLGWPAWLLRLCVPAGPVLGLMSVDVAGVAHESDLALLRLHAVANAPIWREMERREISERICLREVKSCREPSMWKEYGWQFAAVAGVVLLQGVMISGLLHERRRRRLAEVGSRQRLAELAHFNRYRQPRDDDSIARELNQPARLHSSNANRGTDAQGLLADLDEIGTFSGTSSTTTSAPAR